MRPLEFQPTPESIPTPNVQYRLQLAPSTQRTVNFTPLNPISFLLRAALIYPKHVALSHRNVETPVEYTFAVW